MRLGLPGSATPIVFDVSVSPLTDHRIGGRDSSDDVCNKHDDQRFLAWPIELPRNGLKSKLRWVGQILQRFNFNYGADVCDSHGLFGIQRQLEICTDGRLAVRACGVRDPPEFRLHSIRSTRHPESITYTTRSSSVLQLTPASATNGT